MLRKIVKRNTVKISYSCMPNLKQNIDGHNKSILHNKVVPSRSLNCRAKTECPMSGNCLKNWLFTKRSSRQRIMITRSPNLRGHFKTRYSDHKSSFSYANKRQHRAKYIHLVFERKLDKVQSHVEDFETCSPVKPQP